MDRTLDSSDIQATCESFEVALLPSCDCSHDHSHELGANDAANDILDGCEPLQPWISAEENLLTVEHWKPTEPQFCKDIAAHYQQSKRTIQKWFVDLKELTPWMAESELRLSDDRYTPLAVDLLGERYFAGSKKNWAIVLSERFTAVIDPDQLPETESSAIDPDVLPQEEDPDPTEALPNFSTSLVPTGCNFLAAPDDEENQLRDLEARELKLLGQMQEGLGRLNHASNQWERASQLRRQRLIRQTRLEAASLAVELEEEFENTLRETQYRLQNGDLAVPGKPQEPTPQPQSA